MVSYAVWTIRRKFPSQDNKSANFVERDIDMKLKRAIG